MTTKNEWLENEGQPAVRADEVPPVDDAHVEPPVDDDAHAASERFRTFDLYGGGL